MATSFSITGSSSLKTDYYLRKYYGNDRNLRSSSAGRSGEKERNLSIADAKALRAAIKDLKKEVDHEDEDSLVEVSAFLNTYNNLMDATGDVDDKDVKAVKSKLNKLFDKYKEELKDMGITRKKSGELDVDKETFQKTTIEELSNLFSKEARFSKSFTALSKKMEQAATDYRTRANQIEKMMSQNNKASTSQSDSTVVDVSI
ncbi:hypothetical protein SAMN02910417_00456 [Eubacterium oxidoreducens]|uniref:Flagellar hook-associated protein 2 C-terminal domain-containing protein n=2 Tax=Eubacterium oxidoreducens TaxID=1732 RepID=A0A1G6ADU5_EUBOX|nr:hypothetical protein SAMN02910417_00456 [Eubacterium oxidoreducens]